MVVKEREIEKDVERKSERKIERMGGGRAVEGKRKNGAILRETLSPPIAIVKERETKLRSRERSRSRISTHARFFGCYMLLWKLYYVAHEVQKERRMMPLG